MNRHEQSPHPFPKATVRQLTHAPQGHLLTNVNVWSHDGEWIVYDTRSDPAGAVFDGTRIEQVNARTGAVRVVYESRNGACCGVATCSPSNSRIVFIHGPEHPTPEWSYAANRRQGVIVDPSRSGWAEALDARDLTPPFTAGALRGGSHVHVFSPHDEWVSFTYQDHWLEQYTEETDEHDVDQRNVGISVPLKPVRVSAGHPRNHDGSHFSVLVTRTTARPRPGTDDITKAFEETWIGDRGYRHADGHWQRWAIAFQGLLPSRDGTMISEVFVVDIPEDVTRPGNGPLEGTTTRRPFPPLGTEQRRLTDTSTRLYPGLQGPRHWLRSSPDGSRIAFLIRDNQGIVQIATVSTLGGEVELLTKNEHDIGSAFTWSPDGRYLAHVMGRGIAVTDVATGISHPVGGVLPPHQTPRPEACVFSPNGRQIAFVAECGADTSTFNQVFTVLLDG